MQPEISIIIPAYNCSRTIDAVLKAIYANQDVQKEIIVVDDSSKDNTLDIVKKYPCKIIQLTEKSGPSEARNRGALEAQSNILMFVDSDAVIQKDSLKKILELFRQKPSAVCISGVFEKTPVHSSYFAKYRDLQLHYFHQSKTGQATIFILTAGAIKKEVFFEIGMFNKKYGQTADIEDFEIGHRISEKYEMLTDKEIKFHHLENASPFFVLIKKLFRRARMWAPLFLKRKKFEKNYATKQRSFAVIFAGIAGIMLLLSVFNVVFILPAVFFLFCNFILNTGFYLFLFKEGGLLFFIYSLFVHFFFSCILFCGAAVGAFEALVKRFFAKKDSENMVYS